jgi:hypothetical protein
VELSIEFAHIGRLKTGAIHTHPMEKAAIVPLASIWHPKRARRTFATRIHTANISQRVTRKTDARAIRKQGIVVAARIN